MSSKSKVVTPHKSHVKESPTSSRSAVTGRYVQRSFVETHPKTTIRQLSVKTRYPSDENNKNDTINTQAKDNDKDNDKH